MKFVRKRKAKDNSIKYLFEIPGKGFMEAIYFNFEGYYGKPKANSKVICLSSQAGCNMGCTFCETGKIGKSLNLSSEEMSYQVNYIQKDLKGQNLSPAKFYALMGMGEPLNNFEEVLKFFHENRNTVEKISISTVGIIPGIKKLIKDKSHDFDFFISLHSPFEKERSKLMPINKKYPLKRLISIAKEYSKKRKEKITFTYMLIPNFNDSLKHARALAKILNSKYFSVQLTCFNPSEKAEIKRTRDNFSKKIHFFMDELKKRNIEFDVQLSKGLDIEGGCGQFSAKQKIKKI